MAFTPDTVSLAWDLLGGKYRMWTYRNADPFSTVTAANYFTDVYKYGVREGDKIICIETDTDPPTITEAYVSAIVDATGNATVTAMTYAGAATFTNMTATGNVLLGNAAADSIGAYGAAGVTRATGTAFISTNVVTSASYGTQQVAVTQAIINALNGIGLTSAT